MHRMHCGAVMYTRASRSGPAAEITGTGIGDGAADAGAGWNMNGAK
jgi:hypothetical protein